MIADRNEQACAFLAGVGWWGADLVPLPGDASTRHYYRVRNGARRAMLMDQPQNAEKPPCPPNATAKERKNLGYNAVARLAGANCARFIAAAEYLRGRGLAAPQILAAEVAKGFVLLEDFGDDLYADVLGRDGDEFEMYAAATDAIVRLHAEPAPKFLGDGLPLYDYDFHAELAEVDLMTEWFFPHALGRPAFPEETAEHRALWVEALGMVRSAGRVFVHRDYHAQNLFWLPGHEGLARVGMIDFQDALAGNRSYDLISLLEDARRDVPHEIARAMQNRYFGAVNAGGHCLDEEAFAAELAVTAAQRNAKIAGIFARLAHRDGKRRYLALLPRVWGYLDRDLSHPLLASLRAWYKRTIPCETRSGSEMAGALA